MDKKKIIFAIILGLILLRFLKNSFMPQNNFSETDAKNAILEVQKKYGTSIAQTVEKMYRLETANFKSSQYILTGTAGMEQGAWGNYVPKGLPTIPLKDPKLGIRNYIVWNPKDFALFLASYIVKYDGNFARWNSTNPDKQLSYKKAVNSITNKFV